MTLVCQIQKTVWLGESQNTPGETLPRSQKLEMLV